MRPRAGLQAIHNGVPYEFLYLVGESGTSSPSLELWRVRPLFVEEADRAVLVRPGDRLTPLHGRARSC